MKTFKKKYSNKKYSKKKHLKIKKQKNFIKKKGVLIQVKKYQKVIELNLRQ